MESLVYKCMLEMPCTGMPSSDKLRKCQWQGERRRRGEHRFGCMQHAFVTTLSADQLRDNGVWHLIKSHPSSVPAGSPSRGGDIPVYVLDVNKQNLPTLSILFLCLFLSLRPFQLYFSPQILSTTLRFLTLHFWSYFCLIGPFNYISLYESLPEPWYNLLWLTGLKAPSN